MAGAAARLAQLLDSWGAGKTQAIFERHYNSDRPGQFGNVFSTILKNFRPEALEVDGDDVYIIANELRDIQLQQLKEANDDAMDAEETMDMLGTFNN